MWCNNSANLVNSLPQALEVYLLPTTDWLDVLSLQRRLVYEIADEPRGRAALVLCEHFPIITVGRRGSRRHILVDESELTSRCVDVRWTNRGGGCWFHMPGQLVANVILPIDAQDAQLNVLRDGLYQTLLDVLGELGIVAEWNRRALGVLVGDRAIGHVGVAIKDWVSYHGCCLNVSAAPECVDWVQSCPDDHHGATSVFRELRLPVRMTSVRESFVRHFMRAFGFARHVLCHAPDITRPARMVHAATGRN